MGKIANGFHLGTFGLFSLPLQVCSRLTSNILPNLAKVQLCRKTSQIVINCFWKKYRTVDTKTLTCFRWFEEVRSNAGEDQGTLCLTHILNTVKQQIFSCRKFLWVSWDSQNFPVCKSSMTLSCMWIACVLDSWNFHVANISCSTI